MTDYDEQQMEDFIMEDLIKRWNYSDEILKSVARVFFPEYRDGKYSAIASANEFLDTMEGSEFDNPKDAWEEWCIFHNIEHEIDSNPFDK